MANAIDAIALRIYSQAKGENERTNSGVTRTDGNGRDSTPTRYTSQQEKRARAEEPEEEDEHEHAEQPTQRARCGQELRPSQG